MAEHIITVISGLFAGLAGIAYAATYSTILPGTGNGMELDAIAGVVVGGTSLAGGEDITPNLSLIKDNGCDDGDDNEDNQTSWEVFLGPEQVLVPAFACTP